MCHHTTPHYTTAWPPWVWAFHIHSICWLCQPPKSEWWTQKSLKISGDTEQGKSIQGTRFEHSSLLFSFYLSPLFVFPQQRAIKLGGRWAWKEGKLSQSLFFPCHPWKEINIHPEIWCYANKTNVMPIANWAPATRFETIKDMFVSVSGAAWCLLPECITLPFTCYPWASEAGFKPMKKTVDLQGKCGRAPDTPNSRHAGCNCGYCGWEFRFTL